MATNSPTLISHRFRGFGPEENTLPSLRGALDFRVEVVEFDVRMSRCGTPFVYHDEHAPSGSGEQLLSGLMASDFATVGGRFESMPTLDALLELAASHPHEATLLIDVKDAGFEEAIHALVMLHGLASRAVYVSWLPEVLYALHRLAPEVPLCLSHWAGEPGAARRNHTVFESEDGSVPEPARTPFGTRSGWWLKAPLAGEMRDMLARTGGYVCVPRTQVSRERVEDYARDGIRTTTFGYVDAGMVREHRERFGIDGFFIDNREVFEVLL